MFHHTAQGNLNSLINHSKHVFDTLRVLVNRACFRKTLEYHLLMFCNALAASILIMFPYLASTLASLSSTCTSKEDICI